MVLDTPHNFLVVMLSHSQFVKKELENLGLDGLALAVNFLHQLWRLIGALRYALLEPIVI